MREHRYIFRCDLCTSGVDMGPDDELPEGWVAIEWINPTKLVCESCIESINDEVARNAKDSA